MIEREHRSQDHPAIARIVDQARHVSIDAALGRDLSGADVTTLLLDAFDRRSALVGPAEVMRQYGQDRFVMPTPVDALRLAQLEAGALESAAHGFEPVALAPLMPFGAHRAMGGTPQNNVVSTARMSEVAADPTNSLALEAAARRRTLFEADSRSTETVHLAATHRVTRAQPFEGPRSYAHFSLLGLVSAGRDSGNFGFEASALRRQLEVMITILRLVTSGPIELRLTAFTPAAQPTVDELGADFTRHAVRCSVDPERTHGRGYYRTICFKLLVEFDDGMGEVGDGGDVWWTQALLQNRKERLMISGLGLERLALLASEKR